MLIIGLNQTMDRTIKLGELSPGTVMRSADVVVTGGGKAVNVARAALVLGHPAVLLGPFPGRLGAFVVDLLLAEGLELDVLDVVDGEVRGTTIILESDGRASVINENGPPLRDGAFAMVLDRLDERLHPNSGSVGGGSAGGGWVVASGSTPPNTPVDAQRQVVDRAHAAGWSAAVDATGDAMRAAIDGGVDLVSPNLAEALAVLGMTSDEAVDPDGDDVADRAVDAAAALRARGARRALVSAGRHGLAGADDSGTWFVPAPAVVVANPIGAGDSLLGATVARLERGDAFADAARFGVAYAAASVADPTGGYADTAMVDRLHSELVAHRHEAGAAGVTA